MNLYSTLVNNEYLNRLLSVTESFYCVRIEEGKVCVYISGLCAINFEKGEKLNPTLLPDETLNEIVDSLMDSFSTEFGYGKVTLSSIEMELDFENPHFNMPQIKGDFTCHRFELPISAEEVTEQFRKNIKVMIDTEVLTLNPDESKKGKVKDLIHLGIIDDIGVEMESEVIGFSYEKAINEFNALVESLVEIEKRSMFELSMTNIKSYVAFRAKFDGVTHIDEDAISNYQFVKTFVELYNSEQNKNHCQDFIMTTFEPFDLELAFVAEPEEGDLNYEDQSDDELNNEDRETIYSSCAIAQTELDKLIDINPADLIYLYKLKETLNGKGDIDVEAAKDLLNDFIMMTGLDEMDKTVCSKLQITSKL